jgi:hypothetical protein
MLLIIQAATVSRINSARTLPEKLPVSHLGLMPAVFIQILNPAPGRASHLGYSHACRYVKQGRAEWAGSCAIRFVEHDHRHQSASRLARTQTAAGYDARGVLRLAEIARLPCIQPVRLITGRKTEV